MIDKSVQQLNSYCLGGIMCGGGMGAGIGGCIRGGCIMPGGGIIPGQEERVLCHWHTLPQVFRVRLMNAVSGKWSQGRTLQHCI